MTSRSPRPQSLATLGLALLLGLAASPSHADVRLEVLDRDAGTTLPVYEADGRRWIQGRPRHEYSLVLRNRSPQRVLVVLSVDGVNVVTGETAAPSQSGYVLEPWQSTSIDGWRKSLDRVAAFRFTRLQNSYAARTGRPNDVGVIGLAVFHEREHPQPLALEPYARDEYPGAAQADRRARSATAEAEADAAAPPAARANAPTPRAAVGASAGALAKENSRLGTAHGRGLESRAQWTNFERAGSTPDELHTLWYDSRDNLIAMGVLPPDRYADRTRIPQPFPGGFVPDP